MKTTKLAIMEQLELMLTSDLLDKFYCISFNTYSVSLQGKFGEIEVLDINDALGIAGESLKLWSVSRGGYVELIMQSEESLFKVNGKGYPLSICLTS